MVLWVFGYGSLIWNPGFDFDQKILGFIKGYKRTFNLACIDHRGTPKDPARTCTLESEEEAVCTTKETGLYLDGCHFLDDNALPTLVQFPCKVGEIIGTMTGFFGFGSQLLSYYQTGSFSILEKLRCYATCTVWGIAYCVNGGLEKEQEAMRYLEKRECEYDQKISVDFYEDANSLEPSVTGVLVFVSTPDPVGNKYYLGPAPLEDMARQIATANGPNGNNRDYLFSMEKALSNISHEDDSIIELADEVRKVLSRSNEKKITGSDIPLKSHAPLVYLSPLLEGTVVDLR